ncbi:MAG: fcf1 [Rhodoferax sp.]|nr:fcf1 [Rhodoferax sp.]
MIVAWVIGSGGLLGKALGRALGEYTQPFSPAERFHWNTEATLKQQLLQAVRAFAEQASAAAQWHIFWTAGVGTFASSAETMAQETKTLALLLDAIRNSPVLCARPGCITLASSAGAIYAGSKAFVITEDTPAAPTTPYAAEKMRHEAMLTALAGELGKLHVFLARISTIYGGGQTSKKSQGLLTHIARCVIRREPVHIYVPYDTIRDYIAVADVAQDMVHGALASVGTPGVTMKLIASEHPTTIAEIIGIFRKIAKRNPRVITSANRLSALYAKRIQFRSSIHPGGTVPARTPLLVGIAQLLGEEQRMLKLPGAQTGPNNP